MCFFGEVDFVDLKTRFLFPFLGDLVLNEVDFVDLEVLIYFCSALLLAGSIALTLRHEFDFYSALTSIGSISLTLRHEIIFCSGSLL